MAGAIREDAIAPYEATALSTRALTLNVIPAFYRHSTLNVIPAKAGTQASCRLLDVECELRRVRARARRVICEVTWVPAFATGWRGRA